MIEIIEPYPAIYISEIDAIAIADLHLGYEGIMAEQGMLIPKVQFKKEIGMLRKIIEKKQVKRIIINGDVKHEFSETSYHEFKEVSDLLQFLEEKFEEVIVIKGNHDNFIARVTKRFDVKLHDELELEDFHFLHGHKIPEKLKKAKHVIIAHEHPAIALFDEIGAKEKMDCFLFGEMGDGKITVLPAFSPLAYGSEVNLIPSSELLSPVLKSANIEKFSVIGISEETGCLDFGRLGKLRRI
ncbi:MAG: metallophosphoesterase [Candidatus Hydrothermarchaeota archaeon]|nr:metallophosphoesterase [Candidatus Hydrothermarchaeota archaeon]